MFAEEEISWIANEGLSGTIRMDPITFEVEGIKKFCIPNLGSKKVDDPDKIPERIIKEVASDIAEVICFLFNQSQANYLRIGVKRILHLFLREAPSKILIIIDQYL